MPEDVGYDVLGSLYKQLLKKGLTNIMVTHECKACFTEQAHSSIKRSDQHTTYKFRNGQFL